MFFISGKYILLKGFKGIAIFPFVIIKSKVQKEDVVFVHHEQIHLRQQKELLILPFFIWYGIEYLIRLVQYHDKREAYLNISFEREAYQHERNFGYLKSQRRFWAFTKYL